MPASEPPMVIPAIVTILPLPMSLFAKVAVAEAWLRVTLSFVSTPLRDALPFTRSAVADVEAS